MGSDDRAECEAGERQKYRRPRLVPVIAATNLTVAPAGSVNASVDRAVPMIFVPALFNMPLNDSVYANIAPGVLGFACGPLSYW